MNQFDLCIIEGKNHKSKQRIKVKCSKCGIIKTPIYSEHKRSCKKQSKYVDKYLCYNCLKKNENFKSNLKNKHKEACNIKEFKDKSRESAKKLWANLPDDFLENHKKSCNSKEYKEKLSSSIRNKFSEDKEYIEKIREARRGYWNNSSYREKRKKINEKHKELGIGIYGEKPIISKLNRILYSILEELDIKYIPEYQIGYYKFDCFLPDYNLLIECNDEYWHSLSKSIRNDKAKSTYIERYFPNYKLKVIWENEFLHKNIVINYIKQWTGCKFDIVEFNFDDLEIRYIDNFNAVNFIQKYHYTYSIGHGRSQIRIGCYLGDILIAVCLFANPTRNESATRLDLEIKNVKEIVRLCRHPLYDKKNFLSWFLSRCLKIVKNDYSDVLKIISFCDFTFENDGAIYKACNFVLDGEVEPSYWYINNDGYVFHKKTIYNHARRMSFKESVYADKNGFKKVFGKKKLRFLYNLRD